MEKTESAASPGLPCLRDANKTKTVKILQAQRKCKGSVNFDEIDNSGYVLTIHSKISPSSKVGDELHVAWRV